MPYYYLSHDPSNNLRRYDKHLICEMVLVQQNWDLFIVILLISGRIVFKRPQ